MIDLQQGKQNEAASLFIEAKDMQPEDQAAVANEALAYLLMSDNCRAFELADRAKTRFPTSARALMVWLNTAPATASLKELKDSIQIGRATCAAPANGRIARKRVSHPRREPLWSGSIRRPPQPRSKN